MSWPAILKAKDVGTRGIEEVKKKNYAEALKLYEQCEGCIIYAIKHDTSDKVKDILHMKLEKYQKAIKRLQSQLARKELSCRSQASPYFRKKSQRPQGLNSRLCHYSQLDNKLQNLSLNDTEKKICE